MSDDADILIQKMVATGAAAFATPVYSYGMCGQMKTLLDRTNSLFPISYKSKDIYPLTTAADPEQHVMDGVIKSPQGWIGCFERGSLRVVIYDTLIDGMDAVLEYPETLDEAYKLGKKTWWKYHKLKQLGGSKYGCDKAGIYNRGESVTSCNGRIG